MSKGPKKVQAHFKSRPLAREEAEHEHREVQPSFTYDSTKDTGNGAKKKMGQISSGGSPKTSTDDTNYVERLAKSMEIHSLPFGGALQNSCPATILIEDEELAEILWKDIFAAVSVTELLLIKAKEDH